MSARHVHVIKVWVTMLCGLDFHGRPSRSTVLPFPGIASSSRSGLHPIFLAFINWKSNFHCDNKVLMSVNSQQEHLDRYHVATTVHSKTPYVQNQEGLIDVTCRIPISFILLEFTTGRLRVNHVYSGQVGRMILSCTAHAVR